MSSKSQAAYESVFEYINKEITSLECRAFMTDYEIPLRNAFAKVVPNAQMSACHFHFIQAVKRYLKKLGELVEFIDSNTEDGKTGNTLFNHLLNLPLLPHNQIDETFLLIKHKALALNPTAFKRFLNYFEKQWIIKVSQKM